MEFIGYHGTNAQNANSIDTDWFSDSSESEWLGAGVYFFEEYPPVFNGFQDAEWWVTSVKKYPYWVIYKANIKSSNVLDLVSNQSDRNKYEAIGKRLFAKHCQAGKRKEDFSCHDIILQVSRKVDVIRCIVDASKMNSKINSYIVGRPQIQLCVCRNSETVINNCVRVKEN